MLAIVTIIDFILPQYVPEKCRVEFLKTETEWPEICMSQKPSEVHLVNLLLIPVPCGTNGALSASAILGPLKD